MDKVSASQPRDHGFEPHSGHDHDTSYDTSTGWFHEADSRTILISCKKLLHKRAKINKFKLIGIVTNLSFIIINGNLLVKLVVTAKLLQWKLSILAL